MTFFVVTFNNLNRVYQHPALQAFYIVFAILATLYTFLWDVVMDWSLVSLRPLRLLQRPLMYEKKWVRDRA
jgi:hypothetical protein